MMSPGVWGRDVTPLCVRSTTPGDQELPSSSSRWDRVSSVTGLYLVLLPYTNSGPSPDTEPISFLARKLWEIVCFFFNGSVHGLTQLYVDFSKAWTEYIFNLLRSFKFPFNAVLNFLAYKFYISLNNFYVNGFLFHLQLALVCIKEYKWYF